MTNLELLHYEGEMISESMKQRRYILRMWNHPMPCPNCLTKYRRWELLEGGIEGIQWNEVKEPIGTCKACGRELKYTVPFFSTGPGWQWSLVPIVLNQGDSSASKQLLSEKGQRDTSR